MYSRKNLNPPTLLNSSVSKLDKAAKPASKFAKPKCKNRLHMSCAHSLTKATLSINYPPALNKSAISRRIEPSNQIIKTLKKSYETA